MTFTCVISDGYTIPTYFRVGDNRATQGWLAAQTCRCLQSGRGLAEDAWRAGGRTLRCFPRGGWTVHADLVARSLVGDLLRWLRLGWLIQVLCILEFKSIHLASHRPTNRTSKQRNTHQWTRHGHLYLPTGSWPQHILSTCNNLRALSSSSLFIYCIFLGFLCILLVCSFCFILCFLFKHCSFYIVDVPSRRIVERLHAEVCFVIT